MKVIWECLSKADRQYMLSQVSLKELLDELMRRANGDDDEDLEEGEEEEKPEESDELGERALALFLRRCPHEAERLGCLGIKREFPHGEDYDRMTDTLERLGPVPGFFGTTWKEVK